MGKISATPAKGMDPTLFRQFKADLELILNWITQEELGNQMGIKRSNINRYIKGNLPITKGFLKKFYDAWGDMINEKSTRLRESLPLYPPPDKEKEHSLTEIVTILLRIETKIDRQAGQPDGKN